RRSQCTNNLKQLGLAAHNYLSTHTTFPPGNVKSRRMDSSLQNYGGWSTQAMLLSALEQTAISNACNFAVVCYGDTIPALMNSTVTTSQIQSFLGPSSPVPASGTYQGKPWTGNNSFASTGASLHYLGNQSLAAPNGLFMGEAPGFGLRDIQDGSSNTIAFAEW